MEEMVLIGYYHFEAKDKSKIYYVIQLLHSDVDDVKSIKKGAMVNIFVSDDIYKKIISDLAIGSAVKVHFSPNYATGKINYSIEL